MANHPILCRSFRTNEELEVIAKLLKKKRTRDTHLSPVPLILLIPFRSKFYAGESARYFRASPRTIGFHYSRVGREWVLFGAIQANQSYVFLLASIQKAYFCFAEEIFESSGKFGKLKPLLADLKRQGRRVLIFSQMTRYDSSRLGKCWINPLYV